MHGRCHWSVPKYSTRGRPVWTKEVLDNRMEKYISSHTLCDIAEVVRKNNIFKYGKKLLNQKRGTAIGTKFAPPYRILFMAELEE